MTATDLYHHIVSDVMHKMSLKTINASEQEKEALSQLQELWENKLMQSGAIAGPLLSSMDLHTAELEAVTATKNSSHLYHSRLSSMNTSIPLEAPLAPKDERDEQAKQLQSLLKSQPFPFPKIIPPGIKEKFLPPSFLPSTNSPLQFQSFDGKPQPFMPPPSEPRVPDWRKDEVILPRPKKKARKKETIDQVDGLEDSSEIDLDDELAKALDDGSDDATGEFETPIEVPIKDEESVSDVEDDDEEEPQTDNLILCQFEKIVRVKNKRKCYLKDGVMRLNGRDYFFSTAVGECEF